MRILWCALILSLGPACHAAERKPYAFGVLNQRSLQLTATYWNPILSYVSTRSGIPLELHIGRTANETTDKAIAGQLDLAFTNHLFTPKRARLGWRVIARQDSKGIRGQVVVLNDSSIKTLRELNGRPVAFANPYGFAGYYLPMEALMRAGAKVVPLFSGNQEAAMGQLLSGQVAAAGVNNQIMADFARRENITYRVLSESAPYFDLAIMASPHVSQAEGKLIAHTFINIAREPAGQRILQQAAQRLGWDQWRGFAPASNRDYANYQQFFKRTLVPINE